MRRIWPASAAFGSLPTPDAGRALGFYRDLLGFELLFDQSWPPRDHGITHVCLDVTDLDGEYERLRSAGVSFHCPPQDLGAGVRTTYARDPDGNVVELQELSPAEHRFALP